MAKVVPTLEYATPVPSPLLGRKLARCAVAAPFLLLGLIAVMTGSAMLVFADLGFFVLILGIALIWIGLRVRVPVREDVVRPMVIR